MNNTEQKIYNLLLDTATHLGFDIVRVRFDGQSRKVLEILIDRIDDQKVKIKDCRNLSNYFSALLDVEDIISDKYFMEVSSAGVERPLVKERDYVKFAGREIDLKLHKSVDNHKKIAGTLIGLFDKQVKIETADKKEIVIECDNIRAANLVFTEKMFRESLKRENIEEDNDEENNLNEG